jgi:hypothetical protein
VFQFFWLRDFGYARALLFNQQTTVMKQSFYKARAFLLGDARLAINGLQSPIAKATQVSIAAIVLAFAGSVFAAEKAPKEFVTQILEPTGGKILRPKNWFYREQHRGPVYLWTLSREDMDGGNTTYTTGFRIQTFVGVKENTGKSAQQFILDFVDKKKQTAKVVSTCQPTELDLFMRICLETEEGPHHILYSLFWGTDDLDVAVVTIAGTTKKLWKTYQPTFERMGAFELIDMKRFER